MLLTYLVTKCKKKQRKEGIKSTMKFIFNRQKTLIYSVTIVSQQLSQFTCVFLFLLKNYRHVDILYVK